MNYKLPEQFMQNMQELLGPTEYQKYLDSFDNIRTFGLRVNTSKISVEDFLKISPFELSPIPWTTNGFFYDGEKYKPGRHPYYAAGLYYLQEPSAMTPAQNMPIEENDIVLDTCAAPGGKSTEMAARLNGSGLIVANDISNTRAQALLKNLEHFGIANNYVISEDLTKLEDKFANKFDKILIDAPCSGEGMFRKEPSIMKTWLELGNEYYVKLQKQIVTSALKMLKSGGILVYSTCTFSPLEDEDIIAYMLDQCRELKLIKAPYRYEGFDEGINGYKECMRLYPHKINGEGHFCAILQKGEKQASKDIKKKAIPLPKFKNEDVEAFFKLLDKEFYNGSFEIKKDKLYFIPDSNIDFSGIRILRSGLLLGELKGKHFEPAQSLALNLKTNEFKQVINLKLEDPRVIKYLKGETLDLSDIDTKTKGWVLIAVDNYPLGFGKIAKGSLKNKYAKGWIWQ